MSRTFSRSLPVTIVRNWTFGALFSHFRHALTQPHKQRFPSSRKQMYDLPLWHSKLIYMAFYLYGTVGGAGTGNTLTGKETRAMTRDLLSWIGLRLLLLQNCFIIKFFQKSERDSSPQNFKNAHLHSIATKTIHAAQGQKGWRQKMSNIRRMGIGYMVMIKHGAQRNQHSMQ